MAKIKTCLGCGAQFEDVHYDGKAYCTRSCASKYKKCKPRTAKPKRYITCVTCGKEFSPKRKAAKYCSRSCYASSPDFVEKQGKRNRGKTVPEHARQAVSLSNTRRNAEQEYTSGRNGHHDSPKAGNIFYRSSYEQVAYQLLDNDDTVSHYRPEPFVISYITPDGNVRRYRPDILIEKDGQTLLVEVKPQWKLSDAITQLKIEAGKQYAAEKGWEFEVWTETKLGI